MLLLAIFLLLSENSSAFNRPPQIARHQDYVRHEECVRRLESEFADRVTVKTIMAKRGSKVTIPCFLCLHPDDEEEVEYVWKPTEDLLKTGLKGTRDFFQRVLNTGQVPDMNNCSTHRTQKLFHIKEKINVNLWKYEWQMMYPGEYRWKTISNNFPRGILSLTKLKLKRFFSREREKRHVGNLYELKIYNVSRSDVGFYRCVRSRGYHHGMYFVDVFSEEKAKSMTFDVLPEEIAEERQMTKTFGPVRTVAKPTPWTECNRCNEKLVGEQSRTVECHVESAVPLDELKPPYLALQLFGSIPCRSSLVPLELRRHVSHFPVLHQHRRCWSHCDIQRLNRTYRERNEFGRAAIMKVLPFGKYLLGERLPRFKSLVERKLFFVYEGNSLILPCRQKANEVKGLLWMTEKRGKLLSANVSTLFGGGDRVYLDGNQALVFSTIEEDDADEYMCFDSRNEVVGVYKVEIKQNDRTKEMLMSLEIVTKFAVFLFIFIMVANLLVTS